MIKKYTIHILSVKALSEDMFDLPKEQNAVILCTEYDREYIKSLCKNILILSFADVTDKKCPEAFKKVHAKKIISFLRSLSEKVTDVYVCCEKGESRSPAVAAALLRMSGRSDKDVWFNPYYLPNTLVYRIVCREYGLRTFGFFVKMRAIINEISYIRAKKGRKTHYERWQILE